jgi:hypothetical protein
MLVRNHSIAPCDFNRFLLTIKLTRMVDLGLSIAIVAQNATQNKALNFSFELTIEWE